jgi:hypothetical protein
MLTKLLVRLLVQQVLFLKHMLREVPGNGNAAPRRTAPLHRAAPATGVPLHSTMLSVLTIRLLSVLGTLTTCSTCVPE